MRLPVSTINGDCTPLYVRYGLFFWLLVTGVFVLEQYMAARVERSSQFLHQAEQLRRVESEWALLLEPAILNTIALENLEALTDYLSQPGEAHRQRLENLFFTLLGQHYAYAQLRYLDRQGHERVRVDRYGGLPRRIPPTRLRDLSGQELVSQARRLAPGQILLLGPAETGQEGRPASPTLRVVMPVAGREVRLTGMVVLDVSVRLLLRYYHNVMAGESGQALVLDEQGNWPPGTRPVPRPGGLLAAHETFPGLFPGVWATLQTRGTGQLETGVGTFSFRRIVPGKIGGGDDRYMGRFLGPHWYLVYWNPPSNLLVPVLNRLASQWPKLALLSLLAAGLGFGIATLRLQQIRSTAHFQRMVDLLPEGIVLHRRGRFLYGNRALLMMLEVPSLQALQDWPVLESVVPEYREEVALRISTVVQGGVAPPRAMEMLTYRRQRIPVETRSVQVDYQGHATNLVVIRDLREQRRIERLRQTFVSTTSHELRSPLTSIRMALDTMLEDEIDAASAEGRKMLTIALASCDRLLKLINDLLDIDRIEAGLLPLDRQPQCLSPLIHTALDTMAGYARQQGNLRLTLVEDFPRGRALVDGQRLIQVLNNLLSNALKHSPAQGEVTVSLAPYLEDQIRITVADQGPGIPEAFADQIFERFAQARPREGAGKGGSGLGLAISRALVEQMGGRIGFDSSAQGTRFHVDLPRWEGSELPEADYPPLLGVGGGGSAVVPRVGSVHDERSPLA